MGWLTTILKVLLPALLAWLQTILKQERDAAKLGITSPIQAAIDVFNQSGDTRPFYAAAAAVEEQERQLIGKQPRT